ncbi:MAG: AI-2E family transporter [Flavobacterium sp. BFFFF2]|nr:MAG: AI-2E family transporter [Flavobacterium sp. BFFFF2]
MPTVFNLHLRQILMLGIVFSLGVLLIATLYQFLPGLLGSITLYILTKKLYNHLTIQHHWHKAFTSMLFVIVLILLIAVPLFFAIQWALPKINNTFHNQDEIIKRLELVSKKTEPYLGKEIFTKETAQRIAKQLSTYIPTIINTSVNLVTNFCMLFFFLFYFLYNTKDIDFYLKKIIPLNATDYKQLADETFIIIRANALGIPLVSIVHGLAASLGYYIFGVENWGFWGFLTGLFSFFPFVGIMMIWVPLTIYYYSIDQNYIAAAVALYSSIVTGNVDYITRISIIKKLGKVHPMITILGVIVGLKLFGFMGIIFGPLLISYFIILVKFYTKEFNEVV